MVFLILGRAPREARSLIEAAMEAIDGGAAAVPAVAQTELLVGARDHDRLRPRLAAIPVVSVPSEVAEDAGSMGVYLREMGRPMELADLLIAATALWLDVPLLHWDGDYPRSHRLAVSASSDHAGAELWRRLKLHPASLAA